MPETTEIINKIPVEDQDKRLDELAVKSDRTPEEINEFNQLRVDKDKKTTQSRIDTLTKSRKEAEAKADQTQKELDDLRLEFEQNRSPKKPDIVVSRETVERDGKNFYTDDTLVSMRDSGEITDAKAFQHQQERLKSELKEELRNEFSQKSKDDQEKDSRKSDAQEVLDKYPHFNKDHPDFNSEDKLFKEANRIYQNGYSSNPKGFMLAINDAKRILQITDNPLDISNEISLRSPSAPSSASVSNQIKEIPLTEDQKEVAIRIYRNQINPVTGRNYTENEAIIKSTKAQNNRRTR